MADMKNRLLFKSDFVEALHALSQTRRPPKSLPPNVSREEILEHALAEQNVIMGMQQELMNALQQENDSSIQKIHSQSETVQALTVWEAKAQTSQKKVYELLSHSKLLEESLLSMKRSLSEKENMISSLTEKLETSDNPRIAAMDSQLKAKQLTVMELAEHLQDCKAQVKDLNESISSVLRTTDHQNEQTVSLPSTVSDKKAQATITHLQWEMAVQNWNWRRKKKPWSGVRESLVKLKEL